MNSQTRKHIIKCIMCNEEIKEPLSSYFAEKHITANPGHLEYRIVVEMHFANIQDNEPSLVFDNLEKLRISELQQN